MMRKNLLGRTGLLVSEIAFGGGVTGGILIKGDETDAVRALNRALAVGINWIDTAALYGNGASEATIGRHIDALEPQPYVSTKVRIERDEMHDIRARSSAAWSRASSGCNLDSVALFQLHNQLGDGGRRPAACSRRSRCWAPAASPTPSTGSRSRGCSRLRHHRRRRDRGDASR